MLSGVGCDRLAAVLANLPLDQLRGPAPLCERLSAILDHIARLSLDPGLPAADRAVLARWLAPGVRIVVAEYLSACIDQTVMRMEPR